MATETIMIDGKQTKTLADRLRPGLRAIIAGINPSPISVLAGHYYQGQLGSRLWLRLVEHGILKDLPNGREDDAAFDQGIGFADLVRIPTARAAELKQEELRAAIPGFIERLMPYRQDDPLILFVFKAAEDLVGPSLRVRGFRMRRLPGPHSEPAKLNAIMSDIKRELAQRP